MNCAALLVVIAAITFGTAQAAQAAGTQAASTATPTASRTPAPGPVPVIKQVFRNNCETASLAMLLAASGVRVDQRVLQRQVAKSGPLDPVVTGTGSWLWGDPELGFVGRAPGGGTAGGFGVYQRPIRALARRHGVLLDDLTRRRLSTIVTRLRAGRPVIAWIGLSEGPYRRWRTPTGRRVIVNFGEHVVVLTGIKGSTVAVNDPLTGSRLTWSVSEFDRRWRLLGRRALGL